MPAMTFTGTVSTLLVSAAFMGTSYVGQTQAPTAGAYGVGALMGQSAIDPVATVYGPFRLSLSGVRLLTSAREGLVAAPAFISQSTAGPAGSFVNVPGQYGTPTFMGQSAIAPTTYYGLLVFKAGRFSVSTVTVGDQLIAGADQPALSTIDPASYAQSAAISRNPRWNGVFMPITDIVAAGADLTVSAIDPAADQNVRTMVRPIFNKADIFGVSATYSYSFWS